MSKIFAMCSIFIKRNSIIPSFAQPLNWIKVLHLCHGSKNIQDVIFAPVSLFPILLIGCRGIPFSCQWRGFPVGCHISRIVCGRPGYVPKSISHRKPLVLHRPLGHYLIVLREKQHWDISCIYQHLFFLNSRTNLFQLFENESSHYTVADHKREKTNVGEEKRRKGAS